MRVLISGFTEFGDNKVNPSRLLAEQVNACSSHEVDWHGADVRGVVLPVEFDNGYQRLLDEVRVFKPDAVVAFGLAASRSIVEIERFALNWRETGFSGPPGEIVPGAPLALKSTLPIEKILEQLSLHDISVGISYSAGSYVCNDLFFQMQNVFLETSIRSGFVHLPPVTEALNGADSTPGLIETARCVVKALVD